VPITLRIAARRHASATSPSPPSRLADGGAPRIGVLVQTAVDELVLPIDIRLTPGVASAARAPG
jgi:hypothetical protein